MNALFFFLGLTSGAVATLLIGCYIWNRTKNWKVLYVANFELVRKYFDSGKRIVERKEQVIFEENVKTGKLRATRKYFDDKQVYSENIDVYYAASRLAESQKEKEIKQKLGIET